MAILKIKDQKTGEWVDIPALQGPPGPQGPAYELTDNDINRIITALKAEVPMAEEQSV